VLAELGLEKVVERGEGGWSRAVLGAMSFVS
jgi:hypothetical protein